MKLYNTLTRTIEEIEPINEPTVGVYTCGPTVYDYAHVGHWFNYVRMDTLIRALLLDNYEPNWIMNITDVGHLVSDADDGEDKLEKGAKREGKSAWEVAAFYTDDFLKGMEALSILRPTKIVKATDHIAEQIDLIKQLEEKGCAYVIDDGVYYDTSKFPGYAAFARLDLNDQVEGARVAYNPQKRNRSDFALWKFSPKDTKRDMEWESPWGIGFPGWHIECSAMSMKYLGSTLDIHTGGIDHIPVHHTNEIAQSEAVTGKRFANTWMHSNHIMIKGEKISKSLGNGIRLQDIEENNINPMALRLHILESHYRNQSTFSWESLEGAQNRLQNWEALADLRWQAQTADDIVTVDWKQPELYIKENLTNDLNTPQAITTVDWHSDNVPIIRSEQREEFEKFLEFLDAAFGLSLSTRVDITDEQKNLLDQRHLARDKKEWDESDRIRDMLAEQNVGVRDTSHGQIWYRI